jgi:hypothetical protein
MRSAMKAVVAVSVAFSTLGALGQEAGGTKRTPPAATSEATPQAGYVFVPESSKEQPGRVHTTYVLRSLDGKKPAGLTAPMSLSAIAPTGSIEEAETPQSLGCMSTVPAVGDAFPTTIPARAGRLRRDLARSPWSTLMTIRTPPPICRPLTATGDCLPPPS